MGDVNILRNDISGFNTGILVQDVATSGISIHKNSIYNNLSYGLKYLGSDTVDATNNWWGSIHGPEDVSGDTECIDGVQNCGTCDLNIDPSDSLGDTVSASVSYCPWATEEQ